MKRQDYSDILPLTGVTVIEIGEQVSAPYCTKIMGNLGANVIKIEAPLKGDPSRLQGPFKDDSPHPERSGLFLFLNSGKKSITLDLESKSGQALFFKLVDDVDVLVENSNLNYLKDLRIEYELLQKRNPKLVMTSITMFNQKSSYNDRPASDINAIAISGIQSTLGDPLREPLNLPYSLCEFQAGAHAAAATLMALFSSKMTGVGQIIHISVADVLAYSFSPRIMLSMQGLKLRREGSRFCRSIQQYPYGILPCKDGSYCLSGNMANWDTFLEIIGKPKWANNPKYKDRKKIGTEYPEEVDTLLAPWMKSYTKKEIWEKCGEKKLPYAPVRTINEVINEPHLKERDFFQEINHPEAGKLLYPGTPFIFSGVSIKQNKSAPSLGEHNEDIYQKRLGVDKAELVKLSQAGVI